MKNLILVAILVSTAAMLACGGGEEPTATAVPTVARSSDASSASTSAGDGADSEPTIVGECRNGVVMQPGEGCSYEGEEGRPADLVISVGVDGSICREKGSVMMSGFMVSVNHVCAEEYAVIDVLEAEISFEPNDDGSWMVTTNQ